MYGTKSNKKLSRKQRRKLRQESPLDPSSKSKFNLKHVEPLTDNQARCFDAFAEGQNLMLHGIAGTGKSFVSLYLALKEIESNPDSCYENVTIIRSVVPTRDMGFLPGNAKEKTKAYEAPYYAICSELYERGDAYELLKSRNMIDFITTSFIRGITLDNTIIVVDEIANMTLHELDSVMTRVGRNCKIIFCGDFRQSDFTTEREKSGIMKFMQIINRMNKFEFVDFHEDDIVRSGLVKSYIIQKEKIGIDV